MSRIWACSPRRKFFRGLQVRRHGKWRATKPSKTSCHQEAPRAAMQQQNSSQSWTQVTEDSRTEFKLTSPLWRSLPGFLHTPIPTMIANTAGGSIPCASQLEQHCGTQHLPCTAPCLCHHCFHRWPWLLTLVLLGPHNYTLGQHGRKLWKFLGCKIIAKCIQTAVTIC